MAASTRRSTLLVGLLLALFPALGCPLVLVPGLVGCRLPPGLVVRVTVDESQQVPVFRIGATSGSEHAEIHAFRVYALDSPETLLWEVQASSAGAAVDRLEYGRCPPGLAETVSPAELRPDRIYVGRAIPNPARNHLGDEAFFLYRTLRDSGDRPRLLELGDVGGQPRLAADLVPDSGEVPRFVVGYEVLGSAPIAAPVARIEVREVTSGRCVWICEAPVPVPVAGAIEYGRPPTGFHDLLPPETLVPDTRYVLLARPRDAREPYGQVDFTRAAPEGAPRGALQWRTSTDEEFWAARGYHWDSKQRVLRFPGWEEVDRERHDREIELREDERRARR